MRIKEIIVVEGKDDTAAINRACQAETIETHGFGMAEAMWKKLELAEKKRGLIIFTDPDHAGGLIRKKIKDRFPKAKEAFLPRKKGEKKGNIGVENAAPEDIRQALMKVAVSMPSEMRDDINRDFLIRLGLWGETDSGKLREVLGDSLGIGGGNGKTFLRKLREYGINKDEIVLELKKIGKECK